MLHVLANRTDEAVRTAAVVVERDGACVPSTELTVDGGYTLSPLSPCAVELSGPAATRPAVVHGDQRLPLGPAPAAATPPAPPNRRRGCAVFPGPPLPVGRRGVGAYLWTFARNAPSSEVAVNVRADGARVRALRWLSRGLAAIDLVATAWTPSVELTVEGTTCGALHVALSVDPGPPVVARLDAAAARTGAPFAITAAVASSGGAAVTAPTRVVVPGCAVAADQVTCAAAGRHVAVLQLQRDDAWIPIATAEVDVAAPPPVTRPAPPPPTDGWWELRARGVGAGDGLVGVGLGVGAGWRGRARVRPLVSLDWQYDHTRFTPVAPVTTALDVDAHRVDVSAGAAWHGGRRWIAEVAAGPAVIRQRCTCGAGSWSGTGLVAGAHALVGVDARVGARTITAGLGGRVDVPVIDTPWPRPAGALFLEVSLASAR